MNKFDAWLEKYKHLDGQHNQKKHGFRGGATVGQAARSYSYEGNIYGSKTGQLNSEAQARVDADGTIGESTHQRNRYIMELNAQMEDLPDGTSGLMLDISGTKPKTVRNSNGDYVYAYVKNSASERGRAHAFYRDEKGVEHEIHLAAMEPHFKHLSARNPLPPVTRSPDDDPDVPIYKR